MIIRGWGVVLTSLTNTSLTLRNVAVVNMLHWLSYDHQGGGLGGCINVFDEYFLYVTEHVAVVNMLHWLSCDYQGGGGGVLTSVTSTSLPLRNMLPLLTIEPLLLVLNKWMVHGNTSKHGDQCPCSTRKTSKCTKKRYTWAYSWIWRHNVALLQSVAAALTKALWHWSVEKKEKMDEWMSAWYDWDDWKSKMSNVFIFCPWRAKSIHCAGETQIFTLESHACQSKWMSILQAFFDKSCEYQHVVC